MAKWREVEKNAKSLVAAVDEFNAVVLQMARQDVSEDNNEAEAPVLSMPSPLLLQEEQHGMDLITSLLQTPPQQQGPQQHGPQQHQNQQYQQQQQQPQQQGPQQQGPQQQGPQVTIPLATASSQDYYQLVGSSLVRIPPPNPKRAKTLGNQNLILLNPSTGQTIPLTMTKEGRTKFELPLF